MKNQQSFLKHTMMFFLLIFLSTVLQQCKPETQTDYRDKWCGTYVGTTKHSVSYMTQDTLYYTVDTVVFDKYRDSLMKQFLDHGTYATFFIGVDGKWIESTGYYGSFDSNYSYICSESRNPVGWGSTTEFHGRKQ